MDQSMYTTSPPPPVAPHTAPPACPPPHTPRSSAPPRTTAPAQEHQLKIYSTFVNFISQFKRIKYVAPTLFLAPPPQDLLQADQGVQGVQLTHFGRSWGGAAISKAKGLFLTLIQCPELN